MALPAQEGIVWFDRSILKNDVADLNKPDQFEKFALVEVVTNRSYDEGYKGYNDPKIPYEDHPRSGKQVVSFDATKYVRWHKFTSMVGPTAKDIKRQIIWNATGAAEDFHSRTKKTKAAYLPVPMPTPEERFMWLDLVFPVRAIYLPLSHVADQRSKRFAAYVQLNLRLYDQLSLKTYRPQDLSVEKLATNVGKTVGSLLGKATGAIGEKVGQDVGHVAQDVVDGQFIPGAKEPVEEPNLHDELLMALSGSSDGIPMYSTGQLLIKPDRTTGLNWRPQWTMRIDTRALTEMLMVPAYMRLRVYASPFRYAKLFHASAVNNKGAKTIAEKVSDPWVGIDYAKVVSNQGGIVVDYKATGIPKSSIQQIILGVLTAQASALPVGGTVLSLGLGYLAEYLDDPEAMLTEHSIAKKGTEVGLVFIQGANSVRKYYAKGNVPSVRFPRRGRGFQPSKGYVEEQEDVKPIYVGKDGEKSDEVQEEEQGGQVDTESEPSDWVDPQRKVDMEDDEDMINSSWAALSYAPVLVEAAKEH